MLKRILIVVLILFLFAGAGIVYLNNVILPKKVKSLIIDAIEEQTNKKVGLESVSINIFKGLVLRNLKIYDEQETYISLKEADCTVLFLPVFKKKVIIPTMVLRSPVISLVRRQDFAFNIEDLFPKKSTAQDSQALASSQPAKNGLSIFIYWVKIKDGIIHFQDSTFKEPFTKTIENFNLTAFLSLPASVKFGFKSQIPAVVPISLRIAGEFRIPEQKIIARVLLQNFSPKEFSSYYQNSKVSIPDGVIDALANLKLDKGVLSVDANAQNKNLKIIKEKISALLNSKINANMQYNLEDGRFLFSGKAAFSDSQVLGMGFVGPVDNIGGIITFNNSGLYSDNLEAKIWGLPVKAKGSLVNFADALLNINIFYDTTLGNVERLLGERLKFNLPGEIKGQGSLYVGVQTKFVQADSLQVHGWLDIFGGTLKLQRLPLALEDMRGRLEFERNQIRWADLNFTYDDVPYNTKCTVTDFKSPVVQFALSSDDLSLDSVFAINNKSVNLTMLDGRYLNSKFSVSGEIDTEKPDNPEAALRGDLQVELDDIKKPLKKFRDKIEKIRPIGLLHGQFTLNGQLASLKSCDIEARFSSPEVGFYGLKGQGFSLNYSQEAGKANIPLMSMSLYEGTLEASASLDLLSQELPFWASLDLKDVRIEKLKSDTPAKDKDVSGILQAQATVNGSYKDASSLKGGGKISITEGKLWQLNLFKGMGALLFTKDFTDVVFKEGYCSFILNNNSISTDELTLRSNIVDLVGPVRMGFDNSIQASLDVQVLDEKVPVSGTFRDVTTAIVGQAGRFGIIEINGTLKNPKYKFKASIQDFIKGIKNTFFH